MKTIFRYPGGKARISKEILKLAPKDYREYREPFVGGGGVFFNIPLEKKRWINDFDKGLMAVYKSLSKRPNHFIKQCRRIKPPQENEELTSAKGGKPLYSKRMKKHFDQLIKDRYRHQALSYFYLNRTIWAGRVCYNLDSRLYFSNPKGWNIINTHKLEEAALILKNVKVTCGNYKTLLESPGKKVWIYCDPPYMINSTFPEHSRLYAHNFSLRNHIAFADQIKRCPHKVCVSYDDNLAIKELFKEKDGFYFKKIKITYCGSTKKIKKVGKEIFITNYPI